MNLSIRKKLLAIVLGIMFVSMTSLAAWIGYISFGNMLDLTKEQLTQTSKMFSQQLEGLERDANITVRQISLMDQAVSRMRFLAEHGPFYLQDEQQAGLPFENDEQIYSFQAQLKLIQALLSIKKIKNFTAMNLYFLPLFIQDSPHRPVLNLRLDSKGAYINRFKTRGDFRNRDTYFVSYEDLVFPEEETFDIATAYSQNAAEIYKNFNFSPADGYAIDNYFDDSWDYSGMPSSKTELKDRQPIVKTWQVVKARLLNPHNWQETSATVGLVMVEQILDAKRLDAMAERLGMDLGIMWYNRLQVTSLGDHLRWVDFPDDKKMSIEDRDYYYASHPVVMAKDKEAKVSALVFSPTSRLESLTFSLMIGTIISAIIAMLLVGLFVFLALRAFLDQPLDLMMAGVRQIASGDLNHRVQVLVHDELGEMASAFNDMTNQLSLKIEDLNQSQKRTASLRIFSNKIHEITDPKEMLNMTFEEVRKHLSFDDAVLWVLPNQDKPWRLEKHIKHTEFLTNSPSELPLDALFTWTSREVVVINHIDNQEEIRGWLNQTRHRDWVGGHLMFLKISNLIPHLMIFYRFNLHAAFIENEAEYLKSLAYQIRITQWNIRTIRDKARMEGELKTASIVQKALLPNENPNLPQVEIATHFDSALETGGDWYGFMTQIPNHLFVLIGDVTGHGTPAALVAATAGAAMNTLEQQYERLKSVPSPADLMEQLNKTIYYAGHPNFLMTFFIADLDLNTGLLTYSNAAHNFPYVLTADGKVKRMLCKGNRLGFRKDSCYTNKTMQIGQHDLLFFYTDGLVENTNPQDIMWGEKKLRMFLKHHHKKSSSQLIEELVLEIRDYFASQEMHDDVTMVACRVLDEMPNKPISAADKDLKAVEAAGSNAVEDEPLNTN